MWANPLAAGRHQRRGLSQLQWRGLHVTLTDAENDRLAGIPWLAITRPLPVTRRHQPGGFVHVQRHALAKTEAGHVVVHAIDAQLVRHVVEIGVVERAMAVEIDPAVAAAIPVAVLVLHVGQLKKPGRRPGWWA